MIARISAWFLIVLVSAICITCPFIRRARKGILFVHYVLMHAAFTLDNLDDDLPIGTNVLSTLHAFALFSLLLEHALMLNKKDNDFHSILDALPLFFMITGVNSLAIFLHRNVYAVTNLMLCIGICTASAYLSLFPRKKTSEIPINELNKIADGTFFYDLNEPLNCVGRWGRFHILLTISRLVVGMVPYIAIKKEVRTAFVVCECLTIWLILTLPVIIGGLVQTVKMIGRQIIEIQLHRRMVEAEHKDRKQNKKRRHEEMLASVEEIFGDETIFKELI
ncbi:hypothetical protein M3Y97_00739400 [Aphelenchoides bicaudatus]|nr:hypothetical protein M3Y97_00739400 [Aphelenchoides bicaudatus]